MMFTIILHPVKESNMSYSDGTQRGLQLLLIFLLPLFLQLSGCTGDETAGPQYHSYTGSSAVAVEITVGRVGTLAKRTVIEMEHLIVRILRASDDSVIVTDTSDLSGHGKTVVSKTFTDLSAPTTYTLEAIAIDAAGEVIHSGSEHFTTVPGDTVGVSLDLDARYSMLFVSFNDIPDSVNRVIVEIPDVDTLDTSFTRGSHDSMTLYHDYLETGTDGIDYNIFLRATGTFFGTDTILYAVNTTVSARSGLDTSYQIVLQWVGPDIPDGAAAFTVTIGTVGTTRINAGFTDMGGLSDLVDDLEDGDGQTRYGTWWYTYDDSIPGGNSTVTPPPWIITQIPFEPVSGGAINSDFAASFTYTLDQGANENPPFAAMGLYLDTLTGWDISDATGIRFYHRGNAFRVRIESTNVTDYGWWGFNVPASTDWELVDLTWSQFDQPAWAIEAPFERTAVKNISFEVVGETGDAGTVWVDDVRLPGFLR